METEKKDQWIAETLNSLQGMQRAELSAEVQAKTIARLPNKRAKIVPLAPRPAWQAAACILVLVAANAFACFRFAQAGPAQQGSTLAKEYFAFTNPPEL